MLMLKNRRELLYALLTDQPDKWFTQEEICLQIHYYQLSNRTDNDRCATILQDIKAINSDPSFEKILVCKNYQYKVANKEEAVENYKQHVRRLIKQRNRADDIRDKMRRNGFLDILEDKWWESYGE